MRVENVGSTPEIALRYSIMLEPEEQGDHNDSALETQTNLFKRNFALKLNRTPVIARDVCWSQ